MKSSNELRNMLGRIDHRGYPAYKDLKGSYDFEMYVLSVDYVQGDPFAAPSGLSIHICGDVAKFPTELYCNAHRRIAFQDILTRAFAKAADKYSFKAKGSGKSGLISVSNCGQEVLERTACTVDSKRGDITVRFEVGLPANGRRINGREAEKILLEFIPECVEKALLYENSDVKKLKKTADLADDRQCVRESLSKLGLCAFVADGSILPRVSGISNKPMKKGVPFKSPIEMKVTIDTPHRGKISGMGIPKGITLIVGGGYHGKSTLLKALELGVYNHIEGDGREFVITDDAAAKIRAEDGRSIKKTDISIFIKNLPNNKDTVSFSTADASGSTSQAANVIESIETGSKLLLIDEDTSATNFMIRDELMQRVIHRDMEPITPFIDRIRELYEEYGVSTIIVAGSSGSYFHVADKIIQMDRYEPKDITDYAKAEAANFYEVWNKEECCKIPEFGRFPFPPKGFGRGERVKIKTAGCDTLVIDREEIELRYLEQLVDSEQVIALGQCVKYACKNILDGEKTLTEIVNELEDIIDKKGLGALCESISSFPAMARPRRQEIFACFNRYRSLKF